MPPNHFHAAALHSHHHAILHSGVKPTQAPTVRKFNAANTTDENTLSISGWQGIRDGDTAGQFLITGTSNSTGVLYVGSMSGQGTSSTVIVPGSSSTSVYGPNNLGGGHVQLVGSYRTTSSSTVNGFFFQGTRANGTVIGTYSTLDYPGATFNYIHSTMGGLGVGNSDGPTANGLALGPGHASIYDAATGELVTNVKYPGSPITTAYGIWYDGGTSYTTVGGFSNRPVNNINNQQMPIGSGYMVDYDSATGRFTH